MAFPFSNFKQSSSLFSFLNLCIYFKMSSTKANPDSEQRGSRHAKILRSDYMVRSSRKRLFSSDGSREHPIIIDDSTESTTKIKASPQKRRRTNYHDPLEPARSTLSKFSEVNQLLRSSKKIVVVSGAGISAKAGCELIFASLLFTTLNF
ncbi:hypothetical protein ACMFMG_010642 [Clarireedia jacksonii]